MLSTRGLDPSIRNHAELALNWASEHGVDVDVTSTFRSRNKQNELWVKYQRCVRTGQYPWARGCRYPANPPGYSAHNYGLAFDSTVDPIYAVWWKGVREAVGFHVPSNDQIHAEHPEFREWLRSVL